MIRCIAAATILAAAPLAAQSRDSSRTLTPSERDSIGAAARALASKQDSTHRLVYVHELVLRGDTAWVNVWGPDGPSSRYGTRVRVERRAGRWVANERTEVVMLKY